jgi:serine-type D-Ala-D-Ala carboxypeptidase/endopeptidase (penicillin-binding protein 4)
MPSSSAAPSGPGRGRRRAGLLLLALLVSSCTRPQVRVAPSLPASPLQRLQADLARAFQEGEAADVLWGVSIQSLASGSTLYSLNADRLLMPASNMKIVTLAAAAERLGWDYTFETVISATAPIVDGVIAGDLVVVGGGDPSINSRNGLGPRVLNEWADALWSKGLRRVEGFVIGDDNAFEDRALGQGWSWDYLAYGYAAPIGALQYNEDVVEVEVAPGAGVGEAARVTARQPGSGLVLSNQAVTTQAGSARNVQFAREPGSPIVVVSGGVPIDGKPLVQRLAVLNATEYLAAAVRTALVSRGIQVTGGALDMDSLPPGSSRAAEVRLHVHRSPPLREVAVVLMKVSQNLYADTLLKALARTGVATGTDSDGRKVVADVLTAWGVVPGRYVIADGSGLSRYNYVTANMLVTILRQMYENPKHREPWLATLPVAGTDGTLEDRMKQSRAEGNVRAKTGTIANVRALSGYVQTAGGELLVFSIIANNFTVSRDVVDGTAERVLDRLAGFGSPQAAATDH